MKPIKISLRQLQMFSVLAETGSFRGAARQLNVSQSALSIAIGQLENLLGVTLFDRTTRSVALTPIGHDLLGPTRRILTDLDHTLSDIEAVAQGRRGTVTVACLYSIATRVMPDMLHDLRQDFAGINVVILDNTTHEIIRLVGRGDADIGVCGEVDLDDSLRFEPVVEDWFSAVLPKGHPLAKSSSVSWSELIGYPMVAMAVGTQIREQIDRALSARKLRINPVIEAWHDATLARLVALGLGVTALPGLGARDESQRTVRRPLTGPRVKRTIGVVTPSRRSLSPAAALLRERLVRSLHSQGIGKDERAGGSVSERRR